MDAAFPLQAAPRLVEHDVLIREFTARMAAVFGVSNTPSIPIPRGACGTSEMLTLHCGLCHEYSGAEVE